MTFWPAMLNLADQRVVVVGGGAVALRRGRSLARAKAEICVVAPQIDAELAKLASLCIERAYRSEDLMGAKLVVIATDDPAVNRRVAEDARYRNIWTNRADDPPASDVSGVAHRHVGPITLAVHTDGISAAAAAMIRDQLLEHLDPDWARLLEAARPWRAKIIAHIANPENRATLLKHLTDADAMDILKQQGDEALNEHYHRLYEKYHHD